jgi:hypothetical protein
MTMRRWAVSDAMEWVAIGVVLVGFGMCCMSLRGLSEREREWREVACALASVVRCLDAWPVIEAPGESHVASVAIPTAVAVIGRKSALERWETQAGKALAAHDSLCEPYGGER